MSIGSVSEMGFAEEPTIEWLQESGWSYTPGHRLAPEHPGSTRTRDSEVVLIDRLRAAISRLNPDLPADAVTHAYDRAMTSTNASTLLDHRDFHQLLLEGVPVSWVDSEGVERSLKAMLIDFDDVSNNQFEVINQLTIVIGAKNRRPDVLLYVNGLPLGQVELKNPANESATAATAVNQVQHYLQTIPDLYRYVEVIGVSDLGTARVGTITTPAEHFAEWKTMDPADARNTDGATKTQLELMLRGVFAPAQFLRTIRDFVVFEEEGSRVTKVMAKYHQVDAVTRAVEAAWEAMQGDKRAGVVWHTTGSGKSWTMAFFATVLRRDSRFRNPTLVFVTDRTNLDNQLSQNFQRTSHLGAAVRQADEIAGSPGSLHSLLTRSSGGIIFTTIQKFAEVDGVMPVLSERDNVIVISDEAHRTQYGRLAQNLGIGLPNAVRIGFTGTPIETADKSTRVTFGDYISVYRMDRAQEDQATVPIFYESRRVPLSADQELVAEVADILEKESVEAQTAVNKKELRLEKLVGAEDRLKTIATDIVGHFNARCEALEGKAMVVGYSRRVAARLTELLREAYGEQAVDCVLSASADDDPLISQFRKSNRELADLEVEFRKPTSPLRIVVVRDMWLTGYDAPCLHTLYVDKPMKNHGLLQAIARVNRVFRDKPGGLVVDYIGIGDDLRDSLQAYNAQDVEDAAISLKTAISGMREKHGVLVDLLYGIDWSLNSKASATARATKLINARDAAIELLLDEEHSQDFLDTHAAFKRFYSLAAASPAGTSIRADRDFFDVVVKELRQVAPAGSSQASPEAEQAVKQFFSEGLAAGEVVDVFALADKDRPEISVLSDEFLAQITAKSDKPNLQVRLLQKLLNDEIKVRLRSNVLQAKVFREEIDKLIARYELQQLSSADVVEALVAVAKKLRAAKRRNEELDLTEEEAAFYDALAGHADDWSADPELAEIARELVRSIKRDLTVDWTTREQAEAAVKVAVKKLLRRKRYTPRPVAQPGSGGDTPPSLDYAADLILAQARALYHRWPEVGAG